jgi:hypothetical protein
MMPDAFTYWRETTKSAPYWLRESSPVELLREASLRDTTTSVRGVRVSSLQGNRSDLAIALADLETKAIIPVSVL